MYTKQGPAIRESISSQQGVTLIELVIAMVIIGIVATTLLGALGTMANKSGDPLPRQQAIAIAESYLAEIRLRSFEAVAACTAKPATRPLYHLTCHYDGLTDARPKDQFGTDVPNLQNYAVSVNLFNSATLPGIAGTDQQRIQVTVTTPDGESFTLSGFRARDWP
ncbi:MAG: prepilin-type cleavage/methylation domain-containing protein [Gammaproteobacteria bacterium CG22_combo_CG10-13_8_21_14_all_40_8]|nr:MAG: prepilin-type cleavage/methylation domain-containing protein [Gammaproteobacteria bacterium CG22_combo_CG10-13_8_21_14_all_40_8]